MDSKLLPLKLYLKIYLLRKKALVALIALSVICGALATAFPLIVALILDKIVKQTTEFSDFYFLLGVTAVLIVLDVGFRVLYSYTDWNVYSKGKKLLLNKFVQHLLSRSTEFHRRNYSGALIADSTKFLEGFSRTNTFLFDYSIPIIVTVVITLGIVFFFSPLIGLGLTIFSILYVMFSYYSRKKESPYSLEVTKNDSEVVAHLADSVTNIDTVISFGTTEKELERHKEKTNIWLSSVHSLIKERMRNHFLLFSIPSIAYLIVLIAGVYLVTEKDVSIGFIYLIITYTNTIILSLSNFELQIPDFLESLDGAQAAAKIMDESSEIQNIKGARPLLVTSGKIELKNIDFSYNNSLFQNFNLEVSPKEQVGIVGASGAGKSTLIKLLLRTIEPDQGFVSVDNQNISQVKIDSLRNNITYVPQEIMLFHRSIKENLSYGIDNLSQEEIETACEKAYIADFIETLPNQYDSIVGERGTNLSGGQRQRISLARAFLKDSPIVVLDEPTSALDLVSEKFIQKSLKELFKDKTVLVIAHRLSTISHLNRIIVLDKGKIIEQGNHSTLIKKEGKYYDLWSHQSKGFI